MLFGKWIKKKENNKTRHYDSLIDAIQKLYDGEKAYIHIVYGGLGYGDSNINRTIGKAIRTHLAGYSMNEMIALSEMFRQYTSLEWSIDWDRISLNDIKSDFEQEKDYVYSLILGSFHPNGYFRERCIVELINYSDTLAFIVLRMNDWVGQVRRCATELTYNKIKTCSLHEIFQTTLSIDKVQHSMRRDSGELQNIYLSLEKRIEKEMVDFPIEQILQYDYEIRKKTYKILFSKKILNQKQVGYLLDKEKQSYCKTLIISGIFHFYDCTKQQIESYLKSKNGLIRRKALEYKYSLLHDVWDGMEDMLLDRSAGVREQVAWMLRKHSGFNVLDYYINSLSEENLAIAIMGVGEYGDKEQIGILLPYLKSEDNKIVKIVILTLGKLMGYDGHELYWEYLMDVRPEVSKSAYLSIRKNSIRYGAKKLFDEYKINKTYHVRKYLVLLIMQENSWERLPYLLNIYNEVELTQLQDSMRMKIINRDMYSKISVEQAELIRKEVDKKKDMFSKEILDGIIFDLKYIVS